MAWKKEAFGTLENGAAVSKYTLTNENGVSPHLQIWAASGWR